MTRVSFDARLDAWREILTGDFVAALEAERFVAHMEAHAPAELQEWLRTHAVTFATLALSERLRRERMTVYRRAGARAFAAAEAAGDVSAFTNVHTINADNLRRPVADMTGADHLFVAGSYSRQGKRVLLLAEFHRAVARRVGDQRTAAVMTEDEYLRLMKSILG